MCSQRHCVKLKVNRKHMDQYLNWPILERPISGLTTTLGFLLVISKVFLMHLEETSVLLGILCTTIVKKLGASTATLS